MHTHFGDEKGAEDLHGHVRDLSRRMRGKNLPLSLVYSSLQSSGVLEARGVDTVGTSVQDVAAQHWKTFHKHEKLQHPYSNKPKDFPDRLNEILRPRRTWESPTVPGHAKSAIAWQWLLHRTQEPALGATASWWSRLVDKHSFIRHINGDGGIIVMKSNFGLFLSMATHVETNADYSTRSLNDGSIDDFKMVFITDPTAWRASEIRAVHLASGVGFMTRSDLFPLVEFALRGRREFSAWELKSALECLPGDHHEKDWKQGSKAAKLQFLIQSVVGDNKEYMQEILELYAKPPEDPEVEDAEDEEIQDLLEDMVLEDPHNTSDLKAYKDELNKNHQQDPGGSAGSQNSAGRAEEGQEGQAGQAGKADREGQAGEAKETEDSASVSDRRTQ